jgi:hypothetical protein
MAMPPATASAARPFTTAITSAIWWLILYGVGWAFSGGSKVVHVPAIVMANVTAMSFVFIPYFATQGVLISMLDGVLKGRILLPDAAGAGAERSENPWRLGVINALIFGVAPAAIGYFVAMNASSDALTPGAFAVRFASAGALLCAAVAWSVSGAPFLRAARVPRGQPANGGDPKPYLWQRFVWPHGVANAIINGALAFALSPVPAAQDGAVVPAAHVVVDAAITFLILTWIIASGVKTHARVEATWGVAPPAAASRDSLPTAAMTAFFASLAFCVALGAIFWLTKAPGMSVIGWAVLRGVACGVYTAWLAKLAAQAVVRSVVSPKEEVAAVKAG